MFARSPEVLDVERVLIVGCPGSGKSTFARGLAEITGLPLYYLDLLWHKSDRTTVSREEFDEKLSVVLEKDRWIIDGNYSRTLPWRLARADRVFLFDLPTEVCLSGVEQRMGTVRPDMPWVETEWDEEFREWIVNFRRDRLPEIEWLIEVSGRPLTVFRSRDEADRYLETLKSIRE